MTKVIYLASAYSHPNSMVQYQRYWHVTQIAAVLHISYKHAYILPITQSKILCDIKPELGGSFAVWKDRDLAFIKRSDEIWVVTSDGWKESIGVQAEIKYALKLKKKVRYVHPTTLKVTNK